MSWLGKLLVAAVAVLGLSRVSAQPSDAGAHWRTLTLMDVEAAYSMLAEDHPGAAQEVGDTLFQKRLAEAYSEAKARAAQVSSYDGYAAVLAGLSVGMGDKHIWSRPLYVLERPDWPGFVLARRGRDFVVVDDDPGSAETLKGARLLSCDGIPADRLADQRLGRFKVVRGIEAQLIQRANLLLLDEANPFLKRPQSCDFEQAGKSRTVALKWRGIWRHDYLRRASAIPSRGAAGFGVRKVGDGYWIAVESFNEKAAPVVEEVRARAEELRAASYVVLDLRGNGGGNSKFGDQIADALVGLQTVVASEKAASTAPACPKVWRTSDRNMKRLQYYRDELGPQQGKEIAAAFAEEHARVAAAKATGKSFSGPTHCAGTTAETSGSATARSGAGFKKPVLLLTDNSCFSSCLLAAERFRRLGAVHVGETTDANTNYMEVREDKLPSGLSMFSTLQAVSPSRPRQIGPFVPNHIFDGSIADTAALEGWIAGLVTRPRQAAR